MALSDDRTELYVSLEGALTTDPDPRRRLVFTFDLDSDRFVAPTRAVQMRAAGNAIGDLTALDACRLIIIERDNLQGPAAATKRIDRLDLCAPSASGFIPKTPIVDLLDIADPSNATLNEGRRTEQGHRIVESGQLGVVERLGEVVDELRERVLGDGVRRDGDGPDLRPAPRRRLDQPCAAG